MVRAITDGAAAVTAVVERPPHLIIIDWNMPGAAALELIQTIRTMRKPHTVRLIILSALSGERDVVMGLNIGADDYIAKPFSLREVVARVAAVLRTYRDEGRRETLSCGDLVSTPEATE
jgi:two-component system response regulator MtrA